jgi:hypothetical protein
MAGFCELATSLHAPIFGILGTNLPIVSGKHSKNSRFGRLRPETRFDLHCVADAAVQLVVYLDMADGQVVLVTTEPLGGGSPVRSVYFVAEQDPEKDKAIIGEMMAPNEKVAMVVSSPMSAQANGEPAAIVPATIQMPKAMITYRD